MNKYQEALDFLGEYSLGCAVTNHKDNTIKVINEYRKPLQELVDKATPKKTIKEPIIRDGYRQYKNYCPICKQELLILGNYCLHCGQAVDWSDY